MSNQDFVDVPDSNPWNTLPGEAPQAPQPVEPEPPVWPETPAQPVEPEPFVSEPAPETVFTSEPVPAPPEPVIYDPVRDEHEPFVDVNRARMDLSLLLLHQNPTHPSAPLRRENEWLGDRSDRLLVVCICVCADHRGIFLVPVSVLARMVLPDKSALSLL